MTVSEKDFLKAVEALRKANTEFELQYNQGGYYKMIDGKFIPNSK